jgi:hypothetical protein
LEYLSIERYGGLRGYPILTKYGNKNLCSYESPSGLGMPEDMVMGPEKPPKLAELGLPGVGDSCLYDCPNRCFALILKSI